MKIIFFDIDESDTEFFEQNCPKELEVFFTARPAQNCPVGDFENADAICVFAINPLDAETLKKFKNLKYIFTRSVGFSHIDKEYCEANNIKVFNTPRYGDYTIAEFTFGILLCAVRKIKHGSNALRMGNIHQEDFIGLELYSKTFGVIGLGAIGQKVAKIAEGFSMNVFCYDIFPKEGYNNTSLDELCEKSDIISIHAPLTEANHHLLNSEMFEKMKDGVVIVNTARGEIIDTIALLAALESKKVAFAALDVVECENLLSHHNSEGFCVDCASEYCLKKFLLNQKLLTLPNVLITPHIAYDTKEAVERILKITVQNIQSVMCGEYENMVF